MIESARSQPSDTAAIVAAAVVVLCVVNGGGVFAAAIDVGDDDIAADNDCTNGDEAFSTTGELLSSTACSFSTTAAMITAASGVRECGGVKGVMGARARGVRASERS